MNLRPIYTYPMSVDRFSLKFGYQPYIKSAFYPVLSFVIVLEANIYTGRGSLM